MGGTERPPWASGKIVEDYRPLYAYWRIARSRGREDLVRAAMLSEDDFLTLRRLVEEGVSSAWELLEELARRLADRVEPEIASRALEEVYGVEIDPSAAAERIARILAGWLLEAGEHWRILRLKRGWEQV